MEFKDFLLGLMGAGGILLLCFYDVFISYILAILAASIITLVFIPNSLGIPLFSDVLFWIIFIITAAVRLIKRYLEFKAFK